MKIDLAHGLNVLAKKIDNENAMNDFLIHEAALLSNLQSEQKYGSTETLRHERNRIIDQLNHLSLRELGVSFNELTQNDSFSQKTEKENSSNYLKVFISYVPEDKVVATKLYTKLKSKKNILVWLGKEGILGGQDWGFEIEKIIRNAHIVIIILSNSSTTKEGYFQKEISKALEISEEKPEGTIFIIPIKIDDCDVPQRLSRWQWIDYKAEEGYKRLTNSLIQRALTLNVRL